MKPVSLGRIGFVGVLGGIVAATALGQATTYQPPTPAAAPHTRSMGNPARSEIREVTGTIKTFHPGKSVVIADASGKKYTLKLDESARVDTALATGQTARVVWMTDSTGKARVSSISTETAEAPVSSEKTLHADSDTVGLSALSGGETQATPRPGEGFSSTPAMGRTTTPGMDYRTPRMTPRPGEVRTPGMVGTPGPSMQPTPVPPQRP